MPGPPARARFGFERRPRRRPGGAPLRRRFGLEALERVGPAENQQLVAAANLDVRFGVELHPCAALVLDADDDDPEPLAEIRAHERLPDERRAGADGNLLEGELE